MTIQKLKDYCNGIPDELDDPGQVIFELKEMIFRLKSLTEDEPEDLKEDNATTLEQVSNLGYGDNTAHSSIYDIIEEMEAELIKLERDYSDTSLGEKLAIKRYYHKLKSQPTDEPDREDRFKTWLEGMIENLQMEKELHGKKERIQARLSMLKETLENYERWKQIPAKDDKRDEK